MSLPECYGKYGIKEHECTFKCRYRTGCSMNSRGVDKGKSTIKSRKVQTVRRPVIDRVIKNASMEPFMATQWGLYMYRRTLDRIGHVQLADEFEFLEKELDEYIRESRMQLLREEVERRKVWDSWKQFVEWVHS